MIGALVAAGMLTVSLDAGALLPEEASLRRTMMPTFEVAAQLRIAGPLEVGLGYGLAAGRERFPGFEASHIHHRLPLRFGAGFDIGPIRLVGGVGPMPIVSGTRFDDDERVLTETRLQLGLVYGLRAETPLTEMGARGTLLLRAVLEGHRRGRRNDAALMLGVAYRPAGPHGSPRQ